MRKAAITAVLVLAAFLLGRFMAPVPSASDATPATEVRQSGFESGFGNAATDALIVQAFHSRQGNLPVESVGSVMKVMADDREGSRHQRFLVRLANGHSLLVAHNIDLAPRIDGLQPGDAVAFKGEYEWNVKGGVIHWTHRDPSGRHAGGWLKHEGRTYQ